MRCGGQGAARPPAIPGCELVSSGSPWVIDWSTGSTKNPVVIAIGAAGSGAAPFRDWADLLAPDLGVAALRLPGRERRMAEPPIDDMETLVSDAADAITASFGSRGVAIFGLCSGALVGFELARRLERDAGGLVRCLIVAGEAGPRRRAIANGRNHATADIWERVRRLGGTDPAVLANREMRELLAPALRADFALIDQYLYISAEPLSIPIGAVAAQADKLVSVDEVREWRRETSAAFRLVELEGGHFFASRNAWEDLGIAVGALVRRLVEAEGSRETAEEARAG
jgi:medium-chain acyl-[acyl-carrier-protein] hydrolase